MPPCWNPKYTLISLSTIPPAPNPKVFNYIHKQQGNVKYPRALNPNIFCFVSSMQELTEAIDNQNHCYSASNQLSEKYTLLSMCRMFNTSCKQSYLSLVVYVCFYLVCSLSTLRTVYLRKGIICMYDLYFFPCVAGF